MPKKIIADKIKNSSKAARKIDPKEIAKAFRAIRISGAKNYFEAKEIYHKTKK